MKNQQLGMIIGILMSVVGTITAVINSIQVYQISAGIWTPLDAKGNETGAGLNIAFLCVGAVLLIGGIAFIISTAKKKSN